MAHGNLESKVMTWRADAPGSRSGTLVVAGPKHTWRERAQEEARRLVYQTSVERRLDWTRQDFAEAVFSDWMESVEYRRPSCFAEAVRAARMMRAPFVEAFLEEEYDNETNDRGWR
jgi:hypothetical protein